jgi:lysophospholipase L1-like esterase
VRKYDNTLKQTCKENNVDFIEIFEEWIKTDYSKLLHDGAHPNAAGHEKIYNAVKDYLERNEII